MAALNLRASARSSISRMLLVVEAKDYAPDRVEIEQTLRNIEAHFNRFVENHLSLVGEAQPDAVAAHEELFAQTESSYDKVCIKLRRLLSKDKTEPVREIGRIHAVEMRMDPLSIPAFDGRPENWLVFKDLFEALVHNRADLEPTYKLGKLRQCVKSENVPMVAGVYTGGYEQVWAELKQRYDNPRRLVEAHVNRLLDLPDHPPDQQRALQDIIDCIRSTLRALSVMKLPTDKWDAIIYPILLRKLPRAASSQWAMSLSDEELPKLNDMLVYFERRALNMPSSTPRIDISQASHRGRSQRMLRANVAATNSPHQSTSNQASSAAVICPHCSGPHRIYRCHSFQNLSVHQRWDAVKKLMLCFNCLNPNHTQGECRSGMCALCNQKHNSLLCEQTKGMAAVQRRPARAPMPATIRSTPGTLPSKPSVIFDQEA